MNRKQRSEYIHKKYIDPVIDNRGSYYRAGRKYEPIDVINDWDLGFNLGNAVKYISRAGRKSADPTEDLLKAIDYIRYEIKYRKEKEDGNHN